MNGFFPKWRIIVFSVFSGLLTVVLLVRYARLSVAQPERIVQQIPQVERGSIVDRNGKPLAVDTNFFHMGINPHKI
ncbi:MAG: peptidoglycan glycosyltransferase, partial [Treponema sp.]|nr:peptidoglycan glycosyltransferase [Treponema sp.]